ncbi:MAG: surface lipoprotein assembly modifier [Paracoccaceae bacterium]
MRRRPLAYSLRALTRRIGLAACLAAGPFLAVALAPPALAEPAATGAKTALTLTVPQARAAARAALARGETGLAIQLAHGVLQADAKDAEAYYVLALAHHKQGDTYLARRAASYAFRYSTHERDRYATSQLAARMALQDKRYTLAQYWLRRSYDYTPNDRARQQAEADFRRLRADNPWQVQLSFSVDPSDNINAGAEDRINDIDGSSVAGLLSPSAQALSGVALNGRIEASYRLHRDADSETRLRFQGFTRRVVLSDDARALLASYSPPTLPGSPPTPVPDDDDFSNSFASLGLSHSFRLGVRPGRAQGNGTGTLGLTYGRAWYGGQVYFDTLKAGAERIVTFGGNRAVFLGAELESRSYANGQTSDSLSLRLGYSLPLADAGRLKLGLNLSHTAANGTSHNLRSDQAAVFAAFEPARKLGPARVTLALGASTADYPDYTLPLANLPDGRQDTGLTAQLSLAFEDFGFAGFAPELTLRGRRTQSNVGRFDTQEMTLSIGLKSNF